MAILNQNQLVAASNATYIDNTSGSITPLAVRTLNDSWISSSITVDQTGSMTVASASYAGTASFALNFNPSATASYAISAGTAGSVVSASYALKATNADNASNADTATFASTAGTANSAVTASYALNFNPAATASYANYAATASVLLGFVDSASYATTAVSASHALTANSATSASYALNAQNANTASLATLAQTASYVANAQTASYVLNAVSASRATSAASADTATTAVNATSASYASNAELLDNLNFTAFVLTSSFSPFSSSVAERLTAAPTLAGNNTFTGTNNFNVVSASYIQALSASIDYLSVVYQTSSVVYSSGSNIFGDAASDVQTLYGTVDIKTGPLLVSGSTILSSSLNVIGATNTLGDVSITGSLKVRPTSMDVTSYAYAVNQGTDATATGGNIIVSRPNSAANATGSVNISGSNNIVLLTAGATNNNVVNNAGAGFRGSNNIVTVVPVISGSNGTGYARETPNFINSVVNSIPTINDNRPSGTGAPVQFSSVGLNSTLTITTSTGSVSLLNSNLAGLNNTITVSGTNGAAKSVTALSIFGNANAVSIDSPVSAGNYTGVLVGGNSNSLLASGSNVTIQGSAVLGYGLALTGSAVATTNYGTVVAGRWNASDNTSVMKETAFVVGTGTSATDRRTSFHVSASGLTTVSNNLVVTGSVNGNVVSASIASNTSSIDFSQGNFYTSLVTGTTNFNITNPKAGQTVNLLLTTAGTGASASFSSNVKQVSGSTYAPTATDGAKDILTFISWDGTSVYLANVKNLI